VTKPGNELLFLALGGSGEIGMNVNLYGSQGKWLMVDLGLTFADPHFPGIDVILPDLEFIEKRSKDLVGLVITHGHEDHIGAIPYLAADLGVPIYATPFTAGLIRGKLEEEGLSKKVRLIVIPVGGSMQLGPFGVQFVPLAHSIPEANGLFIQTKFGNVFHTGDWKLDAQPLVGQPANPDLIRSIGDKGVTALVCDSTNVFNEKASGSEADVREGLMEVVGAAKGRVMVTSFASNAARVQTLGEVAVATGRKVCVAGRSLDRILKVARATGYMKGFPETLDFDAAMRVPPSELLIIATGGQGEDRAALARVASNSHQIKLSQGDTVIFSSRQIPGNEVAVGRIQNRLAQKGVHLVTDREAFVHVSGHPGRPELQKMYEWIRPEIIVPVHGEMRHLAEHARFAVDNGIAKGVVQTNGTMLRLAPNGPALVGHEKVGRLILDGDVILPADGAALNERRRIAQNGIITVAIALNKQGGVVGEPGVTIQGMPVEEDRDDFIVEMRDAVLEATRNGQRDAARLNEKIRLSVRRAASDWTGKKPVVDVSVIRV